MTSINNEKPKVSIANLENFILDLETYYQVLLEENRYLTQIEAQKIYEVQKSKRGIFVKFEQSGQKIEEIFMILNGSEKNHFSKKITQLANKKIKSLLEKIQVLGKANQSLIQSLDKHTNDLLKEIAPDKHQITYGNLKKKKS